MLCVMSQQSSTYVQHTLPPFLLKKNGELVDAVTYVQRLLDEDENLDYTLDDLHPTHLPQHLKQKFPHNYDRGETYLNDARYTLDRRRVANLSSKERLQIHLSPYRERFNPSRLLPYSTKYPLPNRFQPEYRDYYYGLG